MQITKEILLRDIESKKQELAQLIGAIKYAQSIIEFIDKTDPQPEPAVQQTKEK